MDKSLLQNLKKRMKDQCESKYSFRSDKLSVENQILSLEYNESVPPIPVIDGQSGYLDKVCPSAPIEKAALLDISHQIDLKSSMPTVKWLCTVCSNNCLPVIRESRCLCGHRLKDHAKKNSKSVDSLPCTTRNCKCKNYFYVVAEGSWVLRCRCKHKHIDHDCSGAPFSCLNPKCVSGPLCVGFDSPWVCNCGHSWGSHSQSIDFSSDDRDSFTSSATSKAISTSCK